MSSVMQKILLALVLSLVILQHSDGADEDLGQQWCIADPQASDDELLGAINWACKQGADICSDVQEGKSCYFPNTLEAHASYVFNAYYQKFKKQGGTCSFQNAAMITELDPSHDSCRFVFSP